MMPRDRAIVALPFSANTFDRPGQRCKVHSKAVAHDATPVDRGFHLNIFFASVVQELIRYSANGSKSTMEGHARVGALSITLGHPKGNRPVLAELACSGA